MIFNIILLFIYQSSYPIINQSCNDNDCVFNINFVNNGQIRTTYNNNGYCAKIIVNSSEKSLSQLENEHILFSTSIEKISDYAILVSHQITNYGKYLIDISLGIYSDTMFDSNDNPKFNEISQMDELNIYDDYYKLYLFFSHYPRISSLYYGQRPSYPNNYIFQNFSQNEPGDSWLAYSWKNHIIDSNKSKTFQVLFSSIYQEHVITDIFSSSIDFSISNFFTESSKFYPSSKFYTASQVFTQSPVFKNAVSSVFSNSDIFTESMNYVIPVIIKKEPNMKKIEIIIWVCAGIGVLIVIVLVIIICCKIKKRNKPKKEPEKKLDDDGNYIDFSDDLDIGL